MIKLQVRFLLPLACAAVALGGCSTQQTRASDTADGAPLWFAEAPRGSAAGTSLARPAAGSVGGDYAGYPGLERFMARMEAEGFDTAELARLFSQVKRQQWIIEQMDRAGPRASKPTQPTGAWLRYRAKFLQESNIAAGTDFWRRHAATLARAEQQYGVPAEYLVAIIGVETRWGGYLGSHRIIDALATLAFDYPRRSEFFTGELAHYLIMARDEKFDPLLPVGSFAGAMGLGQFMPSSFRRYAVDFDGDGRRDLWNSEDAIGSVANYFIGHGWRTGQPVAERVRVAKAVPASLETGFPSNYRTQELAALGIEVARLPAGQQRLSLLRLDIGSGYEYWVGFDNFYVITRYNHSSYYAMAVHQLAQALKARRGGASRTLMTEEKPTSAARG
ncbi:Membrane-bound lytic murein transglycosylase B precursor [Thiorhodovibrio winogradskyi]|uniref:Membrane-bound lytic murein transglycosylase B n=1 Tax=Thiorhodovibrio winogradskyi TaxID=77007 RepID=A0ABZ0SG93_9GAMM|nr:lytic murein transglycosylase B [Thiorhodovibrio winogradskyi]